MVRESIKPVVPAVNEPTNVEVIVIVAVSPIEAVTVDADNVRVSSPEFITALDGATERTPRPNAAIATSAMRLKVVFVDILFLSVVVMKTFSMAALR
jgi:hypothetical protein